MENMCKHSLLQCDSDTPNPFHSNSSMCQRASKFRSRHMALALHIEIAPLILSHHHPNPQTWQLDSLPILHMPRDLTTCPTRRSLTPFLTTLSSTLHTITSVPAQLCLPSSTFPDSFGSGTQLSLRLRDHGRAMGHPSGFLA